MAKILQVCEGVLSPQRELIDTFTVQNACRANKKAAGSAQPPKSYAALEAATQKAQSYFFFFAFFFVAFLAFFAMVEFLCWRIKNSVGTDSHKNVSRARDKVTSAASTCTQENRADVLALGLRAVSYIRTQGHLMGEGVRSTTAEGQYVGAGSFLPLKADIPRHRPDTRSGPAADIAPAHWSFPLLYWAHW